MFVFLHLVPTWLRVLKPIKDNYFCWFLLRALIQRPKHSLYNTHFHLQRSSKYCPRYELTSHFSIMFSDRNYYVFQTESDSIDQFSFVFHSFAISTRGLKKQRNTSKLSSQSYFQKVNVFHSLSLDFPLTGVIGSNWSFLNCFTFPILF